MTTRRSNWMSFVIAPSVGAGLLVVLFVAAIGLLVDADDLARGWSNPARYESVRRESLSVHDLKLPKSEHGDFDGDGVVDKLEVVYLHREFLTQESTSGMVYVWSGMDGAMLLAHPVPTPMSDAFWCGDSDGDRSDEVFVNSPPSERFSFRPDLGR